MNIGIGVDHSVREYYEKVCKVLGYKGKFTYDVSKPAGMRQKLMNSETARLHGWNPSTNLDEGLSNTITWKNTVNSNVS